MKFATAFIFLKLPKYCRGHHFLYGSLSLPCNKITPENLLWDSVLGEAFIPRGIYMLPLFQWFPSFLAARKYKAKYGGQTAILLTLVGNIFMFLLSLVLIFCFYLLSTWSVLSHFRSRGQRQKPKALWTVSSGKSLPPGYIAQTRTSYSAHGNICWTN